MSVSKRLRFEVLRRDNHACRFARPWSDAPPRANAWGAP